MAWYDPTSWFEKAEPEPAAQLPQSTPATDSAPPSELEAASKLPMDVPIGTTGLRRTGGYVDEELLVKLSGRRAARVYREMSDNSPIVGAVLYVIEMLLRQVEWRVEPQGETPRQKEAAKFFEECIEDMSHTWDEFVAEVLSMLPFGWSFFEIVYKLRRGPGDDARYRSRFTDGRVGLRKLSIRSQDTLDRWEFDNEGTVLGMWQQDPWSGQTTVLIPLQRALLFRTTSRKNNPEGRSCLRNAYRPWHFAKRIEEIEAIGIERDLTGLPVAYVPPEIMSPSATPQQKQLRQLYQTLVQQIRRDEREGIVFPAKMTPKGEHTGYELALIASPGRRSIDTSGVVTRHEQRIAMTMLAEFIFLGTQQVGSYSLASTKTTLFSTALGGHMENIASTVNRYLIPRLMGLNGYTADEYPSLVYGDLETPDLDAVATAINNLVGAGVLVPDDAIERKLREMLKLPQKSDVPEPARAVPNAPPPEKPRPATSTAAPPEPPKPNRPPTVGPAAEE